MRPVSREGHRARLPESAVLRAHADDRSFRSGFPVRAGNRVLESSESEFLVVGPPVVPGEEISSVEAVEFCAWSETTYEPIVPARVHTGEEVS